MASAPAPAGAIETLAPLGVALPPAPQRHHYFNDAQWSILLSIMDAVMPRVARQGSPLLTNVSAEDKKNIYIMPQEEYEKELQEMKKKVVNPPDEGTWEKYLWEKGVELEGFDDGLNRMLGEYTRKDQRDGLAVLLTALR